MGRMGRAGRLNGRIVESRYGTVVCVVCPRGLGGEEKMNQLDLWAQKRERIQNIVEVRRK
jgi:hypothetical protein